MKKRLAKLIPAVLAASMMLSAASPVSADVTRQITSNAAVKNPVTATVCFNDVKEKDYFYRPVYWAKAYGITSGTSGNTYSPNQPCTRAQMVTFLWRLAGSPASSWQSSFQDVASNSPYAKAIQWADDVMLTQGTGPNTFSPNAPCHRGEMAAFLWRFNNSPQTSGSSGFSDVSASSYYANAVVWAKANGITAGTDAKHYSPNKPCTRGEMAAFLYRMNGSPEVTVNTPTPSVTPTPSPNPSPSPSPSPSPTPTPLGEGKEQPGKGARVEGNENYGHWVTQNALKCNGCGKYFWGPSDYGYEQRITHGLHDHGSQTSVIDHKFWVWDDIPRIEDPYSGQPFYSEEDWNAAINSAFEAEAERVAHGVPLSEEEQRIKEKYLSMSWAKDAIAPTK